MPQPRERLLFDLPNALSCDPEQRPDLLQRHRLFPIEPEVQPQKYVAHSAIMFADRITTPLMLITGQQDSNVPSDNTREMYYALRRLGKDVVWVDYMNGGHGGGTATADDFLDMYRRMVEFYDSKLQKKSPEKTATN